MTCRIAVARIAAAALTPIILAACAGAVAHPRRSAVTEQSARPQPPVASATASAVAPTVPPLNLRSVDWSAISVPGQFCYVPVTVILKNGAATAASSRWGHVQFLEGPKVVYGNVHGNIGKIAAVNVMCTNGSGTADGELVDSYIIFTGAGGKLADIGIIVPQEQPPGVPVSLISRLVIAKGSITVHEAWYHQGDPTCCPTGRATTVWTYANGKLSPGTPHVTA